MRRSELAHNAPYSTGPTGHRQASPRRATRCVSECSLITLRAVQVNSASRPRRRRVAALAPEERRAALIAATLPLLREHGASVTTRQIADAAGVAEGTIFGVFPDKASLIVASLLTAFDPERAKGMVRRIDPSADLRERLIVAVDHLARRFQENGPLLDVARSLPPQAAGELFRKLGQARCHLQEAIVELFEPDRLVLRQTPATAARLLLSLVFAAARDEFGGGETLTSDELVAVLLDGLLVRPLPPKHLGDRG
jgi:AcrR family transcriptional regulator